MPCVTSRGPRLADPPPPSPSGDPAAQGAGWSSPPRRLPLQVRPAVAVGPAVGVAAAATMAKFFRAGG